MSDPFAGLDSYLPEPTTKGGKRKQIEDDGEFHRGELTTSEQVAQFVKAGNAVITLQSKKTGSRFTFKVNKPEEGSKGPAAFFVNLLNGPDNNSNYQYMGIIRNEQAGERFTLTRNSKITANAPSYKAFEFFWRAVVAQRREPTQWGMRVFHEGRCGRCGRRLTVPSSIESGFGPECQKYMR